MRAAISRASSHRPALARAYTSHHSFAEMVPSATIAPAAPIVSDGSSADAEPTWTWKVLGVWWMIWAHCGMLPDESLIPQTFGCWAMRATVSASRLTPVLSGKLYIMIGIGDASATAR